MISGRAPEFDLPSLAGGRETLSDLLLSGPVLLAFYKVSCPTCQLTFPFLERLHRGRRPDGPRIVAICQDEARAAQDFNRIYGISFATLLDPREENSQPYPASNAYRIANVPSLFLVEPDREISIIVAGFEKAVLERIGKRVGVEPFTATERVPVFQPG